MDAIAELNRDFCKRAISHMKSPYEMKIICIDVTNKCDLACSNCTRLLENQDRFWEMTPENWRLALQSLRDYPGIIAMIGGNPSMHRNFKELCQIFVEEVPNKEQRGLWTNNIFKHNDLAVETFGVFNLNPHGDERGIKSLVDLKDLAWYNEGYSHHAPLLTAIKDIYPDEEEMWDKISNCDINQHWSASIAQVDGELRAYFCEIGASFDLARNEDHGIVPYPGWWKRNISEFEHQVRHFCPGCGVAAKLKGHMDYEETDTYSRTNSDIAQKSLKKNRKIISLEEKHGIEVISGKVTDYSDRLKKLSEVEVKKTDGNDIQGSTIPVASRPFIKPVAEFFLTFGRKFNIIAFSNLGKKLWQYYQG